MAFHPMLVIEPVALLAATGLGFLGARREPQRERFKAAAWYYAAILSSWVAAKVTLWLVL